MINVCCDNGFLSFQKVKTESNAKKKRARMANIIVLHIIMNGTTLTTATNLLDNPVWLSCFQLFVLFWADKNNNSYNTIHK